MGKKQHIDWTSKSIMSSGSERVSLLNKEAQRKANEDGTPDDRPTDLELGGTSEASNVGFGRVLHLAKPDAGKLIIATVALLIASTSSLLVPKFGGRIIDIVSRNLKTPDERAEAWDDVKKTILAISLIVVVGSICTALRTWLFSSASERVVARLRKKLFGQLIQQEIAFFDVTRTGELLSRLSEDTQIIKSAATTNLSESLRNVTTALIGIGFMISSSWKLTLLALVVVPLISVGVRMFGRYLKELSHATQAAAAVAASIAEESFGAIRTVRSFAREQHAISGYSEKVDETLKLGIRQARMVGLFFGGLNAASTLSVIIVVIYGAYLTIMGHLTAGALTSFILYSLTVGSSVSSLSGLYTTAMKAAGASRRVFQLLDRVSTMPKSGDKCPISDPDGDVELSDVWFAYPSRPSHMVLKEMTRTRLTARKKVTPIAHIESIQLDDHQSYAHTQNITRSNGWALRNHDKTIRRMRATNFKRRQQVEDLTTKLEVKEKRINEIFEMFKIVNEENSELRDSLFTALGQAKQAKEELEEEKQQNAKGKKRLENLSEAISCIAKVNHQLIQQGEALKIKIKENREGYELRYQSTVDLLDEAEADVHEWKTLVAQLNAANAQLSTENANLTLMVEALQEEEPEEEPEEEEPIEIDEPIAAVGDGEIDD